MTADSRARAGNVASLFVRLSHFFIGFFFFFFLLRPGEARPLSLPVGGTLGLMSVGKPLGDRGHKSRLISVTHKKTATLCWVSGGGGGGGGGRQDAGWRNRREDGEEAIMTHCNQTWIVKRKQKDLLSRPFFTVIIASVGFCGCY